MSNGISVSAASPATVAPGSVDMPREITAAGMHLRILPQDELHARTGTYEVFVNGMPQTLDRQGLVELVNSFREYLAQHPEGGRARDISWTPVCTEASVAAASRDSKPGGGDQNAAPKRDFVAPEPPRLSQGPGTGVRDSASMDDRKFKNMPPPNPLEEYQYSMHANQQINILTAPLAVATEAAGFDSRPPLLAIEPENDMIYALGGMAGAKLAQPKMCPVRPSITTDINAVTGEGIGADKPRVASGYGAGAQRLSPAWATRERGLGQKDCVATTCARALREGEVTNSQEVLRRAGLSGQIVHDLNGLDMSKARMVFAANGLQLGEKLEGLPARPDRGAPDTRDYAVVTYEDGRPKHMMYMRQPPGRDFYIDDAQMGVRFNGAEARRLLQQQSRYDIYPIEPLGYQPGE